MHRLGHDRQMDILPWTRGQARTPMDLTFTEVQRSRPVDLISPGFSQHLDRFDGQKGVPYEQLAPAPETRPGHVDRRYSTLSVSGDEPFFTLFKSQSHPDAPYASVVVDVKDFAASGGEQDTVFAGLVKDEDNYVMAWFSGVAGTAGVDTVVNGQQQTLAGRQSHFTAPCRVAFVMTGTWVGAFVEQRDGFAAVALGQLPEGFDVRRAAALADYHYGFGVRSSRGTVALDGVEAGHFGQLGLRDPRLVTHADGTPYTRSGQHFVTMTHAGNTFFETAHWGVWKLDPATHRLQHEAKLFFQRDGSDAVLGDHSGHLVRDEANDRWIVATSTWGDFSGDNVGVAWSTVPLSTNLLKGIHVLGSEPLALPVDKLPTEAVGQWEPHIVRIDNRWHVGFVNAREFFDFYPALAVSEPGGPLTDLTLAGADPSKNETAGVSLTRFGGRWFLLASSGEGSAVADRNQFPVYDLSMNQLGTLPAPHPTGIPWPTIFSVPVNRRRSRWTLLTFDGTPYDDEVLGHGSHGDLVVMHSRPFSGGAELTGR